jgi:hypothetical protein
LGWSAFNQDRGFLPGCGFSDGYHKRIESLSVQQSIMGRLLDYGTLLIHGTGGGREAIPNIAQPLKFRNAAMAAQSGA